MANTSGDSGIKTTVTTRLPVFGGSMAASTTTADYGVATNTSARPDTRNPLAPLYTNPPSAASDPGSA